MAAARRRLANEGEADRIERAMMAGVEGARPVATGGLRLAGVRGALFHRLTQPPGEHLRRIPRNLDATGIVLEFARAQLAATGWRQPVGASSA